MSCQSLIKDPEQKKELGVSVLFLKETYNFYHEIRILKHFYQRPIKITCRLGPFYLLMRLELNQLTKKGQGLATDETANAAPPRTLSVGSNDRAGGAPGGAGIVKSTGPLPHSAV